MRKTKIICTMGPKTRNEEMITELALAGMDVARLNFSHGEHSDHFEMINFIKSIRNKLGKPIAILLDTRGPECRIKSFKSGSVSLKNGNIFKFCSEDIQGDEKKVSVTYKNLFKELEPKDIILLNDGLIKMEVLEVTQTNAKCKVIIGGELKSQKSMSFPDKVLKQKYLSEQDMADIKFGIEQGVDFIACSFVSNAQNIIDVKDFIKTLGIQMPQIIAKIENRAGVENIEEILKVCDGIMIARGDMGVEIPFEELPFIQKKLITKCRLLGKRVITATEMLESMIHNPRPTRAEISDVANAVYDGTSAIMLSGETAAGAFPTEATKIMSKIAEQTENSIHYQKRFKNTEFKIKNTIDAISHAICAMAIDIDAKAIVVCSLSGRTARMVSRFRPTVPIIGITTDEKNLRSLSLSWGIIPKLAERFATTDALFANAKSIAKDTLNLQKGDRIIIMGGKTNGKNGNTNLIKIATI